MKNKLEEPKNTGFFQELGLFMLQNRKWWLVPIVVVMVLMGVLVVLSSTSAAPFIYSLF